MLFLGICAALLLSYAPLSIQAWDSAELQMFDLVEDMKVNFYEFMGVKFNASSSEIRRAYRRLSLEMHPDKRKDDPDADKKFQKLVAVYEVLRDDEMRNKYNEVLEHGLPDWKMPVYYFRKLRKMTIWETVALMVLLVTTFHFAVLWGVYLEKKLNEEDRLNNSNRRRKALEQRKLKGGPSAVEAEIAKELGFIPRPRWIDILPIAIVRGVFWLVVNSPELCKGTFHLAKDTLLEQHRLKINKKREEEERKKELEERIEKRRLDKEKKKQLSKQQYEEQLQFICREASTMLSQVDEVELSKAEASQTVPEQGKEISSESPKKSTEWEPEELVQLIQAVAKYPGGTTNRWQKISDYVQRPVAQVISMVKLIQEQQKSGVSLQQGGIVSSESVDTSTSALVNGLQANGQLRLRRGRRVDIWDAQQTDVVAHWEEDTEGENKNSTVINPLLSESSEDEDEHLSSAKRKQRRKAARKKPTASEQTTVSSLPEEEEKQEEEVNTTDATSERKERRKPRTKEKYVSPESLPPGARPWSQEEQSQLEQALRAFPKGTADRWDRVAEKVPSRTKEECITRVKHLAEKMHSKEAKA